MSPLTDAERLRQNLRDLSARFAVDPAAATVRPRVSTRLVGSQSAEARWSQYDRDFALRCDEAPERAGEGQHPSPLRYFLSGIAFCQQVWYAKGAALVGCALDDLRIDVRTALDQRGELKVPGADVPTHPQYLVIDAAVQSPSPSADVLAMVDEANSRCPLYRFAARAVPVYERIVHNGQTIRSTVPPGLL